MTARKKKTPAKGGRIRTKSRPDNRKKSSKKTTRTATPRQLMLADLKRSGLTATDAKNAGYKPLTAKQVNDLTGNYAAAYLIPYHDVHGERTGYWRVRYIEDVLGPFGAKKKKPLRYTGPKDELPRFYFPSECDWTAAANDPGIEIVITEGEKKAEKACRSGLTCISVPGVWAWRSKKKGITAIPDFDVIDWRKRRVLLCFDNDVMTNRQVIAALNALGSELTNRGARVVMKWLPKGRGKIGLDDYLFRYGVDAFLNLKEEDFANGGALYALNERLAFINKQGKVYDLIYKRFYNSKAELLYGFANSFFLKPTFDKNGDPAFKKVNAAQAWLEWPQRLTYDELNYLPGQSEVVGQTLNNWPGYACDPISGDVRPFLDLVQLLFGDEREAATWFMQWIAYPLQYPTTKLSQAVLLHSLTQGVGKSLLGEVLGDIYGENFNIVGQDELHSQFNEWLVRKQFIVGEEITGRNSRNDADRLKNMITRPKFNANQKHQPTYEQSDFIAYFLTSNQPDAAFLDDNDRRYFVHEITAEAATDEFYSRIAKWRQNGGASHLFHYLLHNVDTSNFNPKAKAPMTKAKEEMIALSKSDLDLFAHDVIRNPEAVLRVQTREYQRDIFDTETVTRMAAWRCERQISSIAVSKALRRVGIKSRVVKIVGGALTLWPLRNTDKWVNRKSIEWRKHYESHERKTKF